MPNPRFGEPVPVDEVAVVGHGDVQRLAVPSRLDPDLAGSRDPQAASEAAQRALIALGRPDAAYLVTLGTALYLAGDTVKAITAYENALTIEPESLGIARVAPSALEGGDAVENAQIARAVKDAVDAEGVGVGGVHVHDVGPVAVQEADQAPDGDRVRLAPHPDLGGVEQLDVVVREELQAPGIRLDRE